MGHIINHLGANRQRCWALAIASVWSLGCGAAVVGRKAGTHPKVEARDTSIVHEECAVSDGDAVKEDVNGDGRPDRTTVSDGSRESCRALDFNFDGSMDAWVYLDQNGNLRRRENDYDRDGRVDEVSVYQAGVLTEQQRATTLAGKLDTWHYYTAGKMARTERDSNGDDYIDQWWEYPAERSPECPLIHSDVDGDGRPDPGATVDVCRDQYVPAARDGETSPERGLDQEGIGEVPTELEPAPAEPPTENGDATPAPQAPSAPREGQP